MKKKKFCSLERYWIISKHKKRIKRQTVDLKNKKPNLENQILYKIFQQRMRSLEDVYYTPTLNYYPKLVPQ